MVAIATGRIAAGQIYDANKAMLMAALKRPGLEAEDYSRVGDDFVAIVAKLSNARQLLTSF